MLQGGARPGYGFCLVIVLLVRPFCAIDGPLLSVILELRRRDRHSMPILPFIVNGLPDASLRPRTTQPAPRLLSVEKGW
jgi:hypothetical protein